MSAFSFTRIIRSWFAPAKEPIVDDDENSSPIKKLARKLLIDAHIQGTKVVYLEVANTPQQKEILDSHQSPRCMLVVYEIKNQRQEQFTIPLSHMDPLLKELESMTDVNGVIHYYDKSAGEILMLRATKGPPDAPLKLVFE